MGQLCERPGCAGAAAVAYGFDAGHRVAWLEPVEPGRDIGALCRRHADAMVVPRGWSLDDRRPGPSAVGALPPAPSPSPPMPDPTAEWSPVAVARTELADVLDATTPLLARAFGQSGVPPHGTATG